MPFLFSVNRKDSDAFNLASINTGSLQKKVATLEEENLQLRFHAAQLRTETCGVEEHEQRLVKDLVKQLGKNHIIGKNKLKVAIYGRNRF